MSRVRLTNSKTMAVSKASSGTSQLCRLWSVYLKAWSLSLKPGYNGFRERDYQNQMKQLAIAFKIFSYKINI
jgi:hypothetical protein